MVGVEFSTIDVTLDDTKCLIPVAGELILSRGLNSLDARLVLVEHHLNGSKISEGRLGVAAGVGEHAAFGAVDSRILIPDNSGSSSSFSS